MLRVLIKENEMQNLTIMDINTLEGQALAVELGVYGSGVPVFISRKDKTSTVGYSDSTALVIQSLNL